VLLRQEIGKSAGRTNRRTADVALEGRLRSLLSLPSLPPFCPLLFLLSEGCVQTEGPWRLDVRVCFYVCVSQQLHTERKRGQSPPPTCHASLSLHLSPHPFIPSAVCFLCGSRAQTSSFLLHPSLVPPLSRRPFCLCITPFLVSFSPLFFLCCLLSPPFLDAFLSIYSLLLSFLHPLLFSLFTSSVSCQIFLPQL